MITEVITHAEAETLALGERLGGLLVAGDVVVLAGELGTGKTVLARGIARGLGVTARVTSPTFTLVHEHAGRVPLRHVDVYRLDHPRELLDLGLDDLLDGEAVVVVEWGDTVRSLLPTDALELRLALAPPEEADDDTRRITVEAPEPSWRARRAQLAAAVGESG